MAAKEDWRFEEYKALRSEIVQSIAKQHQILLSGYGFCATLAGLVIGILSARVALLLIPFAFLAMAALWTVECNRMVRASYYIAYNLWPFKENDFDGWERWIRREGGSDHASDFRTIQHKMQVVVTLGIPVVVSVVCGFAASGELEDHATNYLVDPRPVTWVYMITVAVAWAAVWANIRQVSNLSCKKPTAGGPIASNTAEKKSR